MSGAPWWAVGAIVAASFLAVPLVELILDHIRQRKGDLVDQKFAEALDEIPDPLKRVNAILLYRGVTHGREPDLTGSSPDTGSAEASGADGEPPV